MNSIQEVSSDYGQFLINTTISRSEFNSKYKSKMISIYKDMIRKAKQFPSDLVDIPPDDFVKGEIETLDEKTNNDVFTKYLKIACVQPDSLRNYKFNKKFYNSLITCIPNELLNKSAGGNPNSNFELYLSKQAIENGNLYILRTCYMRGDHVKPGLHESTINQGGYIMRNESNLLTELNEAKKDILSEFDMQYTINNLAFLLEKAESIEHKILYTAEAVPVFIMNKENGTTYLIEQENLNKLMNSQHIDTSTALRHIRESLEEELTRTINVSDLAVVFAREDMDKLQSIFKENASRIDARCEIVSEYTNFLNQIISEGARVIFRERRY